MGGRYYLYPITEGVRVLGRDPGWLLPQGGRLGAGSNHDQCFDPGSFAAGAGRTPAASRLGASF